MVPGLPIEPGEGSLAQPGTAAIPEPSCTLSGSQRICVPPGSLLGSQAECLIQVER